MTKLRVEIFSFKVNYIILYVVVRGVRNIGSSREYEIFSESERVHENLEILLEFIWESRKSWDLGFQLYRKIADLEPSFEQFLLLHLLV